jgi:hypothetical protein
MPKSPSPRDIGIYILSHRMHYGITPVHSGMCRDIGTPESHRNPQGRLANIEAEASPQRRSL